MLKGLKIKNYKSFDSEGVYLENLEQVNILIGKNNSGKSNILRFLDHLGKNLPIKSGPLSQSFKGEADHYDLDFENKIEFSLFFELREEIPLKDDLLSFTQAPYFLTYRSNDDASLVLTDSFLHAAGEEKVRKYVEEKLGRGGEPYEDRLMEALRRLQIENTLILPQILFIDEFRKIIDNKALRKDVYDIIHYDFAHLELKKKSEQLRDFVSAIIGEPVEIRVPDINQEIELVIGEKKRHLPLSSIGTGIHEIIILGLQLITTESVIVCLDEPELHLHPGTQRTFLKHIVENTDHQYFISTHSNTFLDHETLKSVYEVKLAGNTTKVTQCQQIEQVHGILDDLGIRASEILQTNGIIWVEGPSDRIYIKKWLDLMGVNKKEGFSYTFQYYGGSLLAHYSVEDDSFKDFLSLLTINRNSYVVMDSDMSNAYEKEELSDTKKRIIDECRSKDIGFWVTEGREIENYLSNKVLTLFHGSEVSRKKYVKIQTFCPSYGDKSKVKNSRKIVELMNSDEIEKAGYDLKNKLTDLVSIIEKWN